MEAKFRESRRKMQRPASAAFAPCMASRSLSATCLWHEDTHGGQTHTRFLPVLTLLVLRGPWERGKKNQPKVWKQVRGPPGAAFLSAVGFADLFPTDRCSQPCSKQRSLCRAPLQPKVSGGKLEEKGREPGMQSTVGNGEASGQLQRRQANGGRRVIVNDAGYLIESDLCEMCGQAEDTLHPRIWVCTLSLVVAARARFGTSELRQEAIAEGVNKLWFAKAIATGPSNLLPAQHEKDKAVTETTLTKPDWRRRTAAFQRRKLHARALP